MLSDDLAQLYGESAFTVRLTYLGEKVQGYFDQEEALASDGSGDALLIKRTVFRIPTPVTGSTLDGIGNNDAVTVYDPETRQSTSYLVSGRELVGDGRETRLVLRPA